MIGRGWRVATALGAVGVATLVWTGGFGTRPGAFFEPFAWPTLQAALAILAWAVSGVVLWARPATTRLGTILVLSAAAIAAGRLIDSDVALLSTVGLAAQWLAFPAQLWALLGYPEARLRARLDRAVFSVLLAAALLHGVVAGTMYEPTLHWPWCEACEPGMNLLLIHPVPGFVDAVYLLLIATIGLAGAYGAVRISRRWATATRPARRVRSPMLLPAIVYLGIIAFFHLYELSGELAIIDLPIPLEELGQVGWFAMLLLPVTFLAGLARARARRGRVADLVTQLQAAPSANGLEGALRRTLGDATLELLQLAPGDPIPTTPDRATTVVSGDDGPLAVIVHDPALLEDVRLLDSTTAAAGLAIENAQLAEELRRRLEEVRASRSRIVQAGDDARRQVERDLHDGAQQRLVSLSLLLRHARSESGGSSVLDEAVEQLDEALRELRDLARGVYPVALVEGGLAAALDGLVERSPIATTVVDVPEGRLPERVEAGAYFVVNEAVTNAAKHSNASMVTVSVRRDDELLVVEVSDDGAGGATSEAGGGLRGLQDRVAALDGTITIVSPPGLGTVVRAELPCASS